MSVPRSFLVAFALMLTLAACSGGDDATDAAASPSAQSPTAEPSETPSGSTSPSQTPAGGRSTEVESDDSALGQILTDGKGNTLYIFEPDAQGPSTCYDDCAATWPAFVAKGELEVSGNDEDPTDATLLGTAPRDDGGQQVTYDGWPLYYFASDQGPGDTNGQGVGDVWWAISPDGEPIRT
jgi:predicted lipoprotein with Yx(FWY)xxD motif